MSHYLVCHRSCITDKRTKFSDITPVCSGRFPRDKCDVHAYLTRSQTKEYLHHLIENSLIRRNPVEKTFRIRRRDWNILQGFPKCLNSSLSQQNASPKDQLISSFRFKIEPRPRSLSNLPRTLIRHAYQRF